MNERSKDAKRFFRFLTRNGCLKEYIDNVIHSSRYSVSSFLNRAELRGKSEKTKVIHWLLDNLKSSFLLHTFT